ncbi:T9SS type A sorting domain-containing protein [Soonwooa sp.]|uniref:type IX secretion system anionic LPS delivery protein PorZ n=1 Tax=Soonwooa sp. TaxID=1938592 RepID=UPI0028B142F4|nr:T9SS type A sorting domain-containing protein [Soonwooa sp.]
MRKALLLTSMLSIAAFNAQNTSRWSDLFSYNNVLAIRDDGQKLIAATENGIFYYNPTSGEVSKLSKANGLHEVKITAFDYNPETKIGLVGYKSGAMDVITPEGVFLIMDIPIANGYLGDKKINHISISGNKAVISVGYGVSIFNLDKREFGDTAFFNTGGAYNAALEAGIFNDKVVVATQNGLLTHTIDTTFPVYNTWTTQSTGSFTNIASKDLIAYSTANQVRFGNNVTSTTALPQSFSNVKDVVITDQNIIVADNSKLYSFTKTGALQKTIDFTEELNSGYVFNNQIFSATKLNGLLNESKSSFRPDGPYNNFSYKVSLLNNQIWVSSGSRSEYDVPTPNGLGYYHFDGQKWNYPDYFINNPIVFNIMDVTPNPNDMSEVFFVNYSMVNTHKGIYKMKNNQFVKSYMTTDGSSGYNRPTGLTFDDKNNLFASISTLFYNDPLVGYVGYYYYNRSSDNFSTIRLVNGNRAQKPMTKDNILYIPCPREGAGGLVMYDYGTQPGASSNPIKFLTKENNLATSDAISAAIDKNENVWIGGQKGIRVLANPRDAFGDTKPQTEPIIIEQNGIGEELFRDSEILQISVDSGNQKWISVRGGGVYYLSSSGEQTYLHFTKANSPLPSDNITDIQIDEKTGKVYFASSEGLMVYQGDVADVNENFGNVVVYPNPVIYASYKGNVRIKGLAEKTNIRITDAAGNVVHSAVARGGYYEWNLNNQKGSRVASGIYFVLMTNADGTDTKTAKIAIVN